MTARILVRPPARPSNGAMALRQAIGDEARLSRLNPVPRQYRTVINWGNSSDITVRDTVKVLNLPHCVGYAANKLETFKCWEDDGLTCFPEYVTTLPEDREGIWLARTKLTGHSGDGIIVVREGDAIPHAPLYTRYIKKREEYRLHVFQDYVIFVQQKRKESEREQSADEKLIRSRANGWVYCIENVAVSDEMEDDAVLAVKSLGLDFGAVDVVVDRDTGKHYMLEVNTAPGLASPTLLAVYVKEFSSINKEY